MRITFAFFPTLVFVVVMICWFVFAGIFLLRRKPPSPPDQKRVPGSLIGVGLQGVSYGLVWGLRRTTFSPVVSGNELISVAAGIVAICMAIGSILIINLAVKTLGKEWSLTARLVEGHELATTGPYAFVRHPIYSGMLGMLVATGLAISHWAGLVVALIFFFAGTAIRIRSEEKLLRAAFGDRFESYARNVRAILPGLY